MQQYQLNDRTRSSTRKDISELAGIQIIDYMNRKGIKPHRNNPQYQELYPIIRRELSRISYHIDNFQCRQCASIYASLIKVLPASETKEESAILEYLQEG